MRELQEKHPLFARYKDLSDIAVLDLKSTLTKPVNEAPVPLVIVRDVLYSTAVRSRSIISFVGGINVEWMNHDLERELKLTPEEKTHLNNGSRYTNAHSLYSNNIDMNLNNETISLRGKSSVVFNAELHLRNEMIHETKFELTNRYPSNTTLHENLKRNLEQVSKMPRIFDPIIWRWKNEKQVIIKVYNKASSKTCEIKINGRLSQIYKAKEEFDSFLSWLGYCAVIRNLDAGKIIIIIIHYEIFVFRCTTTNSSSTSSCKIYGCRRKNSSCN